MPILLTAILCIRTEFALNVCNKLDNNSSHDLILSVAIFIGLLLEPKPIKCWPPAICLVNHLRSERTMDRVRACLIDGQTTSELPQRVTSQRSHVTSQSLQQVTSQRPHVTSRSPHVTSRRLNIKTSVTIEISDWNYN